MPLARWQAIPALKRRLSRNGDTLTYVMLGVAFLFSTPARSGSGVGANPAPQGKPIAPPPPSATGPSQRSGPPLLRRRRNAISCVTKNACSAAQAAGPRCGKPVEQRWRLARSPDECRSRESRIARAVSPPLLCMEHNRALQRDLWKRSTGTRDIAAKQRTARPCGDGVGRPVRRRCGKRGFTSR